MEQKSSVWITAVLLLVAIVVIPVLAFQFGEPLTELQTQALKTVAWICFGSASVCFLISELTQNYSQVDKLWSILPAIYVGVMANIGHWTPKLTLMFVIVLIWSMRLTYNFSRRGGYSWRFWEGEEDYRWSVLRKDPMFNTRIKFSLFNFFFISFYQNILILLFSIPAILCIDTASGLTVWDILIAVMMLFFIAYETIADQQQWIFQNNKYSYINKQQDVPFPYDKGFISSGLWSLSRHPNYFAEQSIWICFYGFSVVASGSLLNWTAIGAILLVLLFQGSANFSEGISASKYPHYAQYVAQTSKFIPWRKKN